MGLNPTDPELREILALARDVARQAGALQRDRYESGFGIDTKSASIDLVTEVDRACEELIVRAIEDSRPQDAILAEEGHGLDREGADWRWIIDPLDGTTNFAHGFPRFCVSIGVEHGAEHGGEHSGQRAVGVVYDPLLDELFEAVAGGGAWLGDRRLKVSSENEFGRALVATGFAYDVHQSDDDNLENFARVVKSARGIRRDGSAALDLCYVAAGRVDAYWELKLHPWDVAAGLLILEEAGGQSSDFDGGPVPRSGREIVATNRALHSQLIHLIIRGSESGESA